MAYSYLEFERPIAELTDKINELSHMNSDANVDISEEVERLNHKRDELIEKTYGQATRGQMAQLSRHPDRPNFLDYVPLIFDALFQTMLPLSVVWRAWVRKP